MQVSIIEINTSIKLMKFVRKLFIMILNIITKEICFVRFVQFLMMHYLLSFLLKLFFFNWWKYFKHENGNFFSLVGLKTNLLKMFSFYCLCSISHFYLCDCLIISKVIARSDIKKSLFLKSVILFFISHLLFIFEGLWML